MRQSETGSRTGVSSSRARRFTRPVVVCYLAVAAVVAAGPAQAEQPGCGDVITIDTVLDRDIGPCSGDGLIVRGSDITVDLGGHRIVAATPNGPLENVGLRLEDVSGVEVRHGTVQGFDAGVAIVGGGSNVIRSMTVIDNVNDLVEPYRFAPGHDVRQQPDVVSGRVEAQEWAAQMLCSYGAGITLESSDDNVLVHNRVAGNGPYGGVALLGDSDGNRLESNRLRDNNALNLSTRSDGTRGPGLCGASAPGTAGDQRGREVQAIGIRIEGPGAEENLVLNNQVTSSALAGISIHSWMCDAASGDARSGSPNERNAIIQNNVRQTGEATAHLDPFADGISALPVGPTGRATCSSHSNTISKNIVVDNRRHGISLHRTVERTRVVENVASHNGGDGVFVAEGATDNVLERNRGARNDGVDGFDGNVACDNNDWNANRFVSVNQICVASRGTGIVGGRG